MKKFSISDIIFDYKKEFDFLNENWKGEVADSYMSHLSSIGNILVSTEKCLERINNNFSKVEQIIEENEEFNSNSESTQSNDVKIIKRRIKK